MSCEHVRDAIVDALNEPGGDGSLAEVEAHLSSCPSCAAFAARQRALDAGLARTLVAPDLSPAFRRGLDATIRRGTAHPRAEVWPDAALLVGFGAATLGSLVMLPFPPGVVTLAGTATAALTYMLLTLVRDSLEDVEQPDR